MDNYVGKRLDGRYEVHEIIGVGGMSVVYKAYDNVDDRIVAIKILKEEFLKNDEFVRRFKNESKAIAVLSHPNIVKVYDVSFGEKLQYIVMEYVDGITLKEYIQKQGAITWNEAVFFVTQILKALQHAHDKGIVHRDIKPQNIILLSNGNIKVTDFGIARFSRSETKTLTESAIGSVHYISPEQAKGEFTDEKADIYSLGVVLYEMLSGKVPFEAESAVSVALMQVQADAQNLTDINPDIPLGLEQICIHAMKKNPKERYQTATEMLLDVEEIIENPATTFDYSYFVDQAPTKYVMKTNEAQVDDADYDGDKDSDEIYITDPNHKKKVIFAVCTGIILLIVAIVLLVMVITNSVNTETSTLENFVGYSYDELVSSNQYQYNFVAEYEKTADAEPGIVIDQSPEAGSKIIEGSQVTLIVAASVDDITVPNCYGLDKDKAKRTLEQYNLLNYTFTTVSSETVEEGLVIYTDPKASSVVSADTQITVYVSSGPTTTAVQTYVVPDVSGLDQSSAKAFLEKTGFSNISFTTEDSTFAKGIVISQSPYAGQTAEKDEAIRVVISSGQTTTTTTQPENYKINLTIQLPDTGQDDRLIVYLNGNQYQSAGITLDGTNKQFVLEAESGSSITIRVLIRDLGVSETKTFRLHEDKSILFSFGQYSTTTEAFPDSTESVEENSASATDADKKPSEADTSNGDE